MYQKLPIEIDRQFTLNFKSKIMKIQKLFFIFAAVAVILTACETDKNSSEINIEPKKATPNAEELILSNAQKTVQLQDQLLDEAEHFLATMNIEVDDNFTQKVQKSSKSEDPAINAKLDSLMQVFESQRPMPVERLFDTDSIPSGLTENDRYIILGDDNMIDKADPSNALMLSNIVRVSKGMEPIEENSQMAKSIFKSRKGFTTSDDKRWPNGEVLYQFESNITDEERAFILNCYNDWSTKTDGKVSFTEVKNSKWNEFCYKLGFKIFIKIKKETLGVISGVNAAGVANGCGKSTEAWIKYDPTWIKNYRTVVHEMGHKLGLQHEHQRPDRDDFLICNKTGSQYDKIEEKYAKFLWWTWKTKSATYTTTYDFMSIMHYTNHSLSNTFTDKNGTPIDTGGESISDIDAEFVKSIY